MSHNLRRQFIMSSSFMEGTVLLNTYSCNGKSIGLDVDGPHHFVNRKPTGGTILKHRQVAAIDGMPFISVPYWEWNDLGQSTFDKQQYLREKLKL